MKKRLIVLGLIMIASIQIVGCSSAKDKYNESLNSGLEKYNSGQSMSKDEYNAVKNFNNYKDSQSSKSYSDWDK